MSLREMFESVSREMVKKEREHTMISFRTTESFRTMLRDAASARGVTVSEYLKLSVVNQVEKDTHE